MAAKHPYVTRFFQAEDSTVNSKEGYCYLINVTITAAIGDIFIGDTFPWVVMTFNLYSNELQLDCYNNYTDWRDGKHRKAKSWKVQGL
jgi:hypothetical protein